MLLAVAQSKSIEGIGWNGPPQKADPTKTNFNATNAKEMADSHPLCSSQLAIRDGDYSP